MLVDDDTGSDFGQTNCDRSTDPATTTSYKRGTSGEGNLRFGSRGVRAYGLDHRSSRSTITFLKSTAQNVW
jgi:hypothetical protein